MRSPGRSITMLTFLSLLALPPARAQGPGAPADSLKTATIRHLLQLTDANTTMLKAMESMVPALRRANPTVPDATWDVFMNRIRSDAPQLIDSIIPIYASRFTQAELDQIVAFYASPVGRRMTAVQPEIFQESFEAGRRWGERIGREIHDSLLRANDPTGEVALQLAMRSDLRKLIIAEEEFFADSVKYTTQVGPGGVTIQLSPGNRLEVIKLTPDGWGATIGNPKTTTLCYIFIGATPFPPATEEGKPVCHLGAARPS